MRSPLLFCFAMLLFSLLASQCCDTEFLMARGNFQKTLPSDPFEKTIVPSQYFDIDPKKDNVEEGEGGVLLVLPKSCFRNSKGEIRL